MKKYFLIICVLLISGCGLFEDLQLLVEESSDYTDRVEEKYGFRPSVSANISNGYFTVSATLKVDSVGDMTVKEVYDVLHIEAKDAFTKPINSMVISITD